MADETPVYVVWNDTISGEDWDMDKYVGAAAPALGPVGGELLTWDLNSTVLEGKQVHKGVAILKFPSRAKLDEWYATPSYQEAKKNRLANTKEGSISLVARAGLHKE